MFHPKVWIFSDADATLVAHGSSNPTELGLIYNFETVSIERSWAERAKVEVFAELFRGVWEGTDPTTLTIKMPEGLRLLKAGKVGSADCPTVDDFWTAWHEDAQKGLAPPLPVNVRLPLPPVPKEQLQIPPGRRWEDGPFAHQGRAVQAWEEKQRRGILAIATGGGKMISSLIAATRLQDEVAPLLVVVAAPYKPLIEQWEREAKLFGVPPIPLVGIGQKEYHFFGPVGTTSVVAARSV